MIKNSPLTRFNVPLCMFQCTLLQKVPMIVRMMTILMVTLILIMMTIIMV